MANASCPIKRFQKKKRTWHQHECELSETGSRRSTTSNERHHESTSQTLIQQFNKLLIKAPNGVYPTNTLFLNQISQQVDKNNKKGDTDVVLQVHSFGSVSIRTNLTSGGRAPHHTLPEPFPPSSCSSGHSCRPTEDQKSVESW